MNRVFAVALLFALQACDDQTGVEVERIEQLSAADQTGGQVTAMPVVVRLLSANGQPLADAPIQWRVIEGGGRVLEADRRTDNDGLASAQWELGVESGQNLLLASSNGATLTIRAFSERRIENVYAGAYHTCALSTAGEAFCWGSNDYGQLGDHTTTSRFTPAPVSGGIRFRSLALGTSFTCGLTVSSDTYCWGHNLDGQLGLGTDQSHAFAPSRVASEDAFASLSAGFVHTCASTFTGQAYCWGSNGAQQLGSAGGSANTPRPVAGNVIFAKVSAGEFHGCGIATDSTAYCWGFNSHGEVGTGVTPTHATQPLRVHGDVRFTDVVAGIRHTCAIAVGGAAYCWGRSGAGEVGTPQFVNAVVPNRIEGNVTFAQVGAGNVSSCGVSSGAAGAATVYCWGDIGSQQYGMTPTPVIAQTNPVVAVGFDHACTVRPDGVWCWGANDRGQRGVAAPAFSAVPARVMFPQ